MAGVCWADGGIVGVFPHFYSFFNSLAELSCSPYLPNLKRNYHVSVHHAAKRVSKTKKIVGIERKVILNYIKQASDSGLSQELPPTTVKSHLEKQKTCRD